MKHQIGTVVKEKQRDIRRLKKESNDKQESLGEFMSELKDMVESANELHKVVKTHVENELKKLADSVGTCLKLNKSADEEMKFIEIVAKYGSNVHGVVLGKDIITQENTLKKLIGNQTNVETVFLDEFMLQEESKVF